MCSCFIEVLKESFSFAEIRGADHYKLPSHLTGERNRRAAAHILPGLVGKPELCPAFVADDIGPFNVVSLLLFIAGIAGVEARMQFPGAVHADEKIDNLAAAFEGEKMHPAVTHLLQGDLYHAVICPYYSVLRRL